MPIERRLRATIAASSLLIFGLDAGLSARPQSLGDVARRESERRRDVSTAPGRSYTNDDLTAVDSPHASADPTAPVPLPPAQETPGTAAGSPGSTTDQPKTTDTTAASARRTPDEKYWRARANQIRERLAKASADLESTRSSLSALDSDPKTPGAARERAVVEAAIHRLQSDVRLRQLEEAKLRTQAEIDKIPAEWIQ